MSEFAGKVVMVTGCARARGIGRAIAVAFAQAGADVAVTDVAAGGTGNENEQGLEEQRLGWTGLDSLAGEIKGLGRRVLTLGGDVSRAADAERSSHRKSSASFALGSRASWPRRRGASNYCHTCAKWSSRLRTRANAEIRSSPPREGPQVSTAEDCLRMDQVHVNWVKSDMSKKYNWFSCNRAKRPMYCPSASGSRSWTA